MINDQYKPITKKRTPSVEKLDELGFDPIEKLADIYKRLEREDAFYLKARDTEFIDVSTDGKKTKRRYSSVAHVGVISQMAGVASSLLRYKYTPIQEIENEKTPPPLVIKVKK